MFGRKMVWCLFLCLLCVCVWGDEQKSTRRGVLNPEKEFITKKSKSNKASVSTKKSKKSAAEKDEAEKETKNEETEDASDSSVLGKLKRVDLVKMDGRKVKGTKALSKKKVIGLYFSAHWCPPCRAFTPKLVEFRNACVKNKQPFEIVFVSCDKDEKAMMGYMTEAKMSWVAVPFNSQLRQELMQHFGVRGIPSLIILDSKGKTLSTNGRGDVTSEGAKAYRKWASK